MSSKIVELDSTTHVKISYKAKNYEPCKIKVETSGSGWSENDRTLLKMKETGNGFECRFPNHSACDPDNLFSLDYCEAEYLYFALKTYRQENDYNAL